MGQIHPGPASRAGKRLSSEQVKFLFRAYLEEKVRRAEMEEVLGVGRSRFFALLKAYRS